ncbi:Ribosomal protein L11 methyltransferase [Caenispirillum salinarum AK4]|uniref:Ribosomal protein L11 methyltransferase n=1 Tax=Caenispirillum salinarum AK4 TaxID=1238182 RepID=K9HCG4_9PROT|nr:50S ribosomal protein L11 methyltransferase [Caenispirillum salinarum]EKV28223.1 Ribosomal protein L11 methyltransferase [Caenispirillum salinarum AK4]
MTAKDSADIWRIQATVPKEAVPVFEAALEEHATAVLAFEIEDGPEKDLWRLDGFGEGEPDRPAVIAAVAVAAKVAGIPEPEVTIAREQPRNWLAENLQSFPPIRAGRYFVHGSHHEDPPPVGTIPLLVDAATAFGSGEHQSTRGCLLALDELTGRRSFRKVLDMGCGTGILGIAAALTVNAPVTAVDIDAEAVRVTDFNARRNAVGPRVASYAGDGFKLGAVKRRGPYDLIFANILARPLMRMAKDVSANLAPGGKVILAGLLQRQERMVLSAYRMQGLVLEKRYKLDPWATLVLSR